MYEQELEKTVRERTENQKKWEDDKELIRRQERSLEDKKEALIHKKTETENQEHTYQLYQNELEIRKNILKYLDMEERHLLDTDRILENSARKLRELEELRRNLEKEEDSLEKEYLSLTSGKILELPEELEKELDDLGIHTVYGMEWLKKKKISFIILSFSLMTLVFFLELIAKFIYLIPRKIILHPEINLKYLIQRLVVSACLSVMTHSFQKLPEVLLFKEWIS